MVGRLRRFYRAPRAWVGVILLLSAGVLQAQPATIEGTVIDRSTGELLPAANVVVVPADRSGRTTGTASDLKGHFVLSKLEPGQYALTVSYIGYVKYSTNITLAAGERKVLRVELEPTGIRVNPISVTASRRPEKLLEAPASVSIVDAEQIEARTSLTSVDHVKALPGIDIAQSGLVQANMTTRGFNGVFSGALLVLTDYRIARVPSLRVNAYSLIPATNDDIDRIELVLGPGSALYGPNSANGVLHILTKSPFQSKGTVISVGGGGRDFLNFAGRPPGARNIYLANFRHARQLGDKVGIKISGQFYRGHDWEYFDPNEPPRIVKGRQGPTGRVAVGDSVDNQRDFNVEKFALDARMDVLFNDYTTLVLSGAVQQIDQIELTGIGAAQGKNWRYYYGQARFTYKNLFAQAFINASNAGDTYLLRTGDLIVDNSKLIVGQVQHNFTLGNHHHITYGADVLLTRPVTEGTINGRNEDNDDMNEYGAYVQSESYLSPKLDLVMALRWDKHNRLKEHVLSPRAALVFKPRQGHNFRITYNRAFNTPDNNNLFLDILSVSDAFGLGELLEPSLGFRPATDIRAQGTPETGFHFRRSGGRLEFRSPLAPILGMTPNDFIPMGNPDFNNAVWGLARQVIFEQLEEEFRQPLRDQGFPDSFIDQLFADFENSILPKSLNGVDNVIALLDPETGTFKPLREEEIRDVPPLKPQILETIEAGYKGVIADRFMFNLDVYHTRVRDRVGPLFVETPNVFLDPETMRQDLLQKFTDNIANSSNFLLLGVLGQLDLPENGGNNNGTPADELTQLFVENATQIPVGTVSPTEALDPTAVILTYRNIGDASFSGLDFGFTYYLDRNWSIGGSYSWMSKNYLTKEEAKTPFDVALNGPKHKMGLNVTYRNDRTGFDAQLRGRYVDGFPFIAGVYVGNVQTYTVFDLNLGYRLSEHSRVTLTINNIFNKLHREIIGAPRLGRLVLLRLQQRW